MVPSEMSKRCSIIIRTKNEERWITSCLTAVFGQTYKNFEIIIVDNDSVDRTLEKARQFSINRIIKISDFLPGKALNQGISASMGDYIVCLSAHCIPVNEYWLENLVKALEEQIEYAGVYGRQEPMSFSTPADKRDLLLVFGLDRRVQSKDSFFHNANSILRREVWQRVPFDETISNIEDRVWGQKVLNLDYKLVYEPEASVYHYHGIHQNGNAERCANVVRIIENMQAASLGGSLNIDNLRIVALIPVRGKDWNLGGKSQMAYTINAAKESAYIDRIFVTTDDEETAQIAMSYGAECPRLRPKSLSQVHVGLDAVLKHALGELEDLGIYADLIVTLEETYPFRESGLIDKMIAHTLEGGFDSVLASKRESNSLWQEEEASGFCRVDSGDVPRSLKEKTYIGLKGLCCVTHPEFIRQERLLGNKVGLYEVSNILAAVEIRDEGSRRIGEQLLRIWERTG